MLQITRQARVELRFTLESVLSHQMPQANDADSAEIGFRLLAEVADDSSDADFDLALTLDAVRADDEVFEHNGSPVLLVDRSTADVVGDLVVDVVDPADGNRRGLREAEP
jgi:hypothetical protein